MMGEWEKREFYPPPGKNLPAKACISNPTWHNAAPHHFEATVALFDKIRTIFNQPEPLAPAAAALGEISSTPVERRRGVRRNARAGLKVLVVDDSATVCAALKKILQSVGCLVELAPDAESGLDLAKLHKPDLIFLDIVLPRMNGFSALRQLRRDPHCRDIPVIMISGNEGATELFFGSAISADDFMKKPFSRSEVFARVERLLDDDHMPRRRGTPSALAPLTTI
jgi:CheY-like chemotaxis protein